MNITITPKTKLNAFMRGFASAFNLSGGMSLPDTAAGFERDAQSLSMDWQRVGLDMQKAMTPFAHAK